MLSFDVEEDDSETENDFSAFDSQDVNADGKALESIETKKDTKIAPLKAVVGDDLNLRDLQGSHNLVLEFLERRDEPHAFGTTMEYRCIFVLFSC